MKRGQKRRLREKKLRQLAKTQEIPTTDRKELNGRNRKWVYTKLILGAIVSVLGVAASLLALYQLAPKMHIRPSGLLNPQHPFSTQFELSNEGELSAVNVILGCDMGDAKMSEGYKNLHVQGIELVNQSLSIPKLRGDEMATFPLNQATSYFPGIDLSAGSADITVMVSYKIQLLPFLGVFHYKQRFITVTNYNGEIQWNPVPSN